MSLIQINGVRDYETIVQENPQVVLEFFATWCPHCKAMEPMVEEIASQNDDIVFAQADIDQNGELADAYGVDGTPTFYFIKNGQPVLQTVGEMPYEDLIDFIEEGKRK